MKSIIQWLLGSGAGELTGQDSWRLGFVAGFDNYVRLALLVVLAAMVYLTVRSYRREGDASRRVKVALATIRIIVIILGMALLFRPAIILSFTKTIHSSLVFLIDDSMSMSLSDKYADVDQRGATEKLLLASGTGGDEQERLPLDMTSRSELVRSALLRAGVVPRLLQDHPVIFLRFSTSQPGREAYTAHLDTLDIVTEASETSDPLPEIAPAKLAKLFDRLSASGHETNLRKALRDTLGRIQGRRVAGIVVVSDGQITSQSAPLSGTRALAAKRGVALYSVCVGDPMPPKDIAVVGLQAPRHIRRGARAEFTVTLAHRNLGGENITVRLLRQKRGEEKWEDLNVPRTVTLKSAPVTVSGRTAKGIQTVNLYEVPTQLGEFVYRAEVDPRSDERNTVDNHSDAVVNVTDEKISVLLVASQAGWEMRYLRDYILRLPQEYRLSVWQQNADKDIDQVSSAEMKLSRLPTKLEQLIGSPGGNPYPGYDVVILYDPRPTEDGFDANFVELLGAFVKRHGKGLCYIAGNKYTDSTIRGGGEYQPLTDMLPVVLAANTFNAVERIQERRPEPWQVSLTPYGREHPITHLGGSADETKSIWSILPGVYWSHPVAKAKLTARVLAVNTNPLRHTSKNQPEPVLAVHSYGKGRVVYVGINATWRWRYVQDGFYHRRLWGNVVRYLATLASSRVTINTGGDRFAAGERITVEVEAFDHEYNPLKDAELPLEIINADSGKTRKIVLEAVSGRPGLFKGAIDASETGTFELRADKALTEGEETPTVKRITVEPPRAETIHTEADDATMRSLASRAENFLWIHEIDKLAELVPPGRLQKKREDPRELWDSRLSLLLIVVLLGVEWVLRKKHNMA